MALITVVPVSGSIVNTGDRVLLITDDIGGFTTVSHVRSGSGATTETVYTDANGFENGFSGTVLVVAQLTTVEFRRDAGWNSSPFRIDAITPLGGSTTYSINYTLAAEGQYPPDMQPFNDPIEGDSGLTVSEGDVAVQSDVSNLNFDDATFDVANDGGGKVTVTGLGGGGSDIEVEADSVSLTTAVTKFNFTGLGVSVFEPVADEIQVEIPTGGSLGVDVQDDGAGTFNAGIINFEAGLSVTEQPIGTALVTGLETFLDLTDTPSTYGAEGWIPRMGAASALIWSPPTAFSIYQYQTSTPPIGGAFLATGGGGTYDGFTSFDIYGSDKTGTDLTEVWDNLSIGDHLVIRDAIFNGGGPTPNGVYLVTAVTPDTGFTTIAVTNVSGTGSPTADTYIEVSPASTGAGSGDITGPVTSGDRAIATWDGTDGDRLQNNTVVISAVNAIEGATIVKASSYLWSENNIIMDEKSAPVGVPTAAFGKVFVRDDTPNVLVFEDDEGSSVEIGSIKVEDQGTPVVPATAGYVNTLNFLGTAIEATDGGDGTIDVTVTPGAAPISTVFTRTGAITADPSDYDASQIDNDSGVTGAFVDDALDNLDTDVTAALTTSSGLGGFVYDDSSTAGAGIGTAEVRFDNANPALANNMFVSIENTQGASVGAVLAALGNYYISFTVAGSGYMGYLQDDPDNISDDTTFYTVPIVSTGASSTPSDGDVLTLHVLDKPIITYTGDVTNAAEVMSIGTDKVVTAHILDDNVTYAKMQQGTAGALIVYDGSGNPVDIGVGTASEVLTSNGSAIPTWESASTPGAHDLGGASHTSTGQASGKVAQADGANAVEWVTLASSDVGYDNATSGLTATEVKSAIDELEAEKAALLHASTHEDGQADEINVDLLSGRLADSQFLSFEEEATPQGQAHTVNFTGTTVTVSVAAGEATVDIDPTAAPHELGGAQHSATSLSALNALVADATLIDGVTDSRLSDDRPADEISTSGTNVTISQTAPVGASYILKTTDATNASWVADTGGLHAAEHEVGGSDLVDHDNLTNYAADQHQTIGVGNTAGKTAYETTGYYYHDTEANTYQRYNGATWDDVGVDVDDATLEVTTDLHVKDAGVIATTKLSATGTKNSTTFLRGDNTWDVPPGGGSGATVGLGTWTKGADTIGATSADQFDVDDIVIADIEAIRILASNPLSSAPIDSFCENLPPTGTLLLQDISAPETNALVFDVTAHVLTASVYWDLTVTNVEDSGTNWATSYSAQFIPNASTDVTLAGTPDYITISGQVITRNEVVATTDLSATGTKNSTTYLRGDDTWDVPPGGSAATLTKSITVESPTASENLSMFYTNVAITVTQITSVILGSTSVTFDIEHGTSRATATGTGVIGTDVVCNSTTTGVVTTTFTDATIPADSFVWLSTSALSGTPTEFNVTVEYTED